LVASRSSIAPSTPRIVLRPILASTLLALPTVPVWLFRTIVLLQTLANHKLVSTGPVVLRRSTVLTSVFVRSTCAEMELAPMTQSSATPLILPAHVLVPSVTLSMVVLALIPPTVTMVTLVPLTCALMALVVLTLTSLARSHLTARFPYVIFHVVVLLYRWFVTALTPTFLLLARKVASNPEMVPMVRVSS